MLASLIDRAQSGWSCSMMMRAHRQRAHVAAPPLPQQLNVKVPTYEADGFVIFDFPDRDYPSDSIYFAN